MKDRQTRILPRSDRRFWRAAGLFCLFLTFFVLLSAHPAGAQTDLSSSMILRDDSKPYDLGPYLYVTSDPDSKLSFQDIYKRHNSGQRGESMRGNVLTLGPAAVPHWVVFDVINQSWTDKWVMTFGQHMQGRVGLIKQIFLYDALSRNKYMDNITPAQNPYIPPEALGPTSVAVNIPRGKEALFFLYVVPQPGLPATLMPRLMTEQMYSQRTVSPLQPSRIMNFFFAGMTGFFLAALIFQRYGGAIFFLLYYAAQTLFYNYGNTTLYNSFPFATEIIGGLYAATALLALLLGKSFLGIGREQYVQSRALYGFILGLIGATTFAAMIAVKSPGTSTLLIHGPVLAVWLFLAVLSLAQGSSGRPGAYQFAGGWFCAFAGAAASLAGMLNILPPTSYLVGGLWYSLFPQGLLFMTALSTMSLADIRARRLREDAEEEESESVTVLRQSKETSENNRLKRLIDHERQVMNELRQRELKQTEEMRAAKDSADEATRAKSAFLAVVSHEIRTPMSGILGMVRLLLETALNRDQREYAQTIQDSGDAMLSLLNDILDFEKIESGKMDLEHADFDLHRLLQGIVTLMSGHAEAKGLTLKIDMDPGIPRYVIGDSVRLRQVLLNLTGNSIKFTSEGGVTLRVKAEGVTAQDVHRIRLSVDDTGIGISPEAQKNLFNPFSQADTSITRKFGGTGLGLAISQRLIEAMGGKIRIDSTPDHGSSFYFDLALEEGTADAIRDRQASGAVAAQKSEKSLAILIVEDNAINQKLLKEFVDRMGHRTSLAGSGEEALALLKDRTFDMILMDIELPGITGMGTTKALRGLADRQKAAVPVIALTGNVRDEDIRQCYAANMNGHLAKPVDPKRLKMMIDKVIKGALDNPVQLAEVAQGFTQFNQIDPGAIAAKSSPPAPLPSPAPAESAPVSLRPPEPALPEEEHFELEGGKFTSEANKAAPIRALAFGLELGTGGFGGNDFAATSETKPAAEPNDIFDLAMLANLRGSIGDESFDDLIAGLFVKADEIVTALTALTAAGAQDDRTAVAARAHELKGMAGNFGLKQLTVLAGEIEGTIKQQNNGGAAEKIFASLLSGLLADLPAANQRAKDALRAWRATS